MRALLFAAAVAAVAAACAAGATPPKVVGNLKVGKSLFKAQACGSCHNLAAAGAFDGSGVGPDLDTATKTYTQMIKQITSGGPGMTPYAKILTTAQIQDLAAFIYTSAHPK
jgi:mono/diheme cytochrome c family protein